MTTTGIQKPPGFMMPAAPRNHHTGSILRTITMKVNSGSSNGTDKLELSSVHLLHENSDSQSQTLLQFDRLQPVCLQNKTHEFGQFVAREAVLHEEYWTAAWLRAETHWEDRKDDRHLLGTHRYRRYWYPLPKTRRRRHWVFSRKSTIALQSYGPPVQMQLSYRFADSHKRKFTEQEFHALKRQSETKLGQKSSCIVTVKKEHGSKELTVLKSVVGTLDVSIRPFLHGETFPGEIVKAPIFYNAVRKEPKNQYGYIANLCVAKSARRQGIARNMLHFAIESAISDGAEQVYVHVHKNNIAAQELYQKIGFKVVDLASPQLSRNKMYLLCYRA